MSEILAKEHLEKMIRDFYDLGNVPYPQRLQMNDKVADVFTSMLMEADSCTDGFVWVPQPPMGRATLIWVAYNLVRSLVKDASGKVSVTCVTTVIYRWGRKLEIAGAGL